MTRLDEQGRPEPPLAGDEVATLLGYLDYQRATLAWKCAGLDAAGLAAKTAASTMTLGGILKHMALVEEGWFSRSLHGLDYQPPWDSVDWKSRPRLGVAHGRRRHAGATPRTVAELGDQRPSQGNRGYCRRRP